MLARPSNSGAATAGPLGATINMLGVGTTDEATGVIREVLHTLGLGENPPASAEITRRVEERCR
jgi:hypothetical protein